MGKVTTVDSNTLNYLLGIEKAYYTLHEKLGKSVTNEVYNDNLDVNEHEYNLEQLKEIALDHYHEL